MADDQPDSTTRLLEPVCEDVDATIDIRHPRDILEGDLTNYSVIAVDHYLEDWHELDQQIPALRPIDGFALAAILRSQAATDSPGPAMTILTGRLPRLAGSLPLESAEYLIAWQHDIEWVFPKSPEQLYRLTSMAQAVDKLRTGWRAPLSRDYLASQWLDLPDEPWRSVALDQITQTRPPIYTVGTETNGSSILRWFLQRILPYPAFLTSLHWVAARLGISARWLDLELQASGDLHNCLSTSQYTGAFSTFLGPRWWRAGVAHMVSELSNGQPFDRRAIQDAVERLSSRKPEFLSEQHPVLAVDPKTLSATHIVDAESATQIAPDGWPLYADTVWAALTDLQDNPEIADMVLDSSKLNGERKS